MKNSKVVVYVTMRTHKFYQRDKTNFPFAVVIWLHGIKIKGENLN